MKLLWHLTSNQFVVETENDIKKGHDLSIFHNDRLLQRKLAFPLDPDYEFLYNRYNAKHLTFDADYTGWKNKGGMQTGDTLNVDQLLVLLPGRMNEIDRIIQGVYKEGTPRYKQLFPHHHKPFYTGGKTSIIDALETMSLAIGSEGALAPAKLLVDNHHTELLNARSGQGVAKGATSDGSSAVKASCHAAMVCQFQDVGFLNNKFPEQPDMVESLFDLELLCNREQTMWKAHLNPSEILAVLIRTFMAGDMMRIKATGKGDIFAYLGSTPGGTDSQKVAITSLHELKFDVELFKVADYSVNRFLTLVNASDTLETRFVLELY